ncbi:MAG: FAD-dependent oxidoreductase [Sulfurimicrobium sp.]|nr:FAD-dependent oxidoreductase [Sulfurimicrobium sp.]MDP1898729.1 FAD-dependent oxidoreductase [Sulfurimicrobium sp.]MDP2197837.1 FAD-dependent oxidoreductase [Sulfurimicrobium sp.]MDP2961945.1 FAD-dependent oxidoreductase [Sulfurimicrobium sp.]MDP3688640.1 FAD-dependent oxidoreductase [Sulfurimicrobium sp.]
MSPLIIIGSGLAGFTLAREWRKLDPATPLHIFTCDDGEFYSKPMLSNAIAGGKSAAQLATKTATQMAQELNAEISAHTEISAIHPDRHSIGVNGQEIAYSRLVLAQGADPIRLPLRGNGADAVLSVNNLDDYTHFRAALEGKKRVAVLGGGLIGCEFANDLLAGGFSVDVIDPGTRPLSTLLPAEASLKLQEALGKQGVSWHFGVKADAVEHSGNALQLKLSDGSTLDADVVLSAIGLRSRTALAAAAGITINRGIVVDNQLKTSAPDIYAIGDCAEAQGKVLLFVMPLMQQARTLAKVLAGTEAELSYPAMPVVIKTPAYPITVCPPPIGSEGSWKVESTPQGVRALFLDGADRLHGFALTEQTTSEKNNLVLQLEKA